MEPNTSAESNTTAASVAAKSSSGPIIGTIVIITLIVIGGLYFWMQEPKDTMANLPLIPGDSTADESWMPPATTSDEAAAIEAELNATNMDTFEAQTNADAAAASQSL